MRNGRSSMLDKPHIHILKVVHPWPKLVIMLIRSLSRSAGAWGAKLRSHYYQLQALGAARTDWLSIFQRFRSFYPERNTYICIQSTSLPPCYTPSSSFVRTCRVIGYCQPNSKLHPKVLCNTYGRETVQMKYCKTP